MEEKDASGQDSPSNPASPTKAASLGRTILSVLGLLFVALLIVGGIMQKYGR